MPLPLRRPNGAAAGSASPYLSAMQNKPPLPARAGTAGEAAAGSARLGVPNLGALPGGAGAAGAKSGGVTGGQGIFGSAAGSFTKPPVSPANGTGGGTQFIGGTPGPAGGGGLPLPSGNYTKPPVAPGGVTPPPQIGPQGMTYTKPPVNPGGLPGQHQNQQFTNGGGIGGSVQGQGGLMQITDAMGNTGIGRTGTIGNPGGGFRIGGQGGPAGGGGMPNSSGLTKSYRDELMGQISPQLQGIAQMQQMANQATGGQLPIFPGGGGQPGYYGTGTPLGNPSTVFGGGTQRQAMGSGAGRPKQGLRNLGLPKTGGGLQADNSFTIGSVPNLANAGAESMIPTTMVRTTPTTGQLTPEEDLLMGAPAPSQAGPDSLDALLPPMSGTGGGINSRKLATATPSNLDGGQSGEGPEGDGLPGGDTGDYGSNSEEWPTWMVGPGPDPSDGSTSLTDDQMNDELDNWGEGGNNTPPVTTGGGASGSGSYGDPAGAPTLGGGGGGVQPPQFGGGPLSFGGGSGGLAGGTPGYGGSSGDSGIQNEIDQFDNITGGGGGIQQQPPFIPPPGPAGGPGWPGGDNAGEGSGAGGLGGSGGTGYGGGSQFGGLQNAGSEGWSQGENQSQNQSHSESQNTGTSVSGSTGRGNSSSSGSSNNQSQSSTDVLQTMGLGDVANYIGSLGREASVGNPYSAQFEQEAKNRANAKIAAGAQARLEDLGARMGGTGFGLTSGANQFARQGVMNDKLAQMLQSDSTLGQQYATQRGQFDLGQRNQDISQRGQDVSLKGLQSDLAKALLGQTKSQSTSTGTSQNQSESTNLQDSFSNSENQGTSLSDAWGNSYGYNRSQNLPVFQPVYF